MSLKLTRSNEKSLGVAPVKESSLMYSGNASKTTHDVKKLFTRQGEQPCFCSLAPLAFFFSLFIYLTSVVLEQPAVMLEQTEKNRSPVLRDISAA